VNYDAFTWDKKTLDATAAKLRGQVSTFNFSNIATRPQRLIKEEIIAILRDADVPLCETSSL
jgi:hypothetical protein